MSKTIDILLWGVTGYTGQLAAKHVAGKYGPSGKQITYALGGRSHEKLSSVLKLMKEEYERQGGTDWKDCKTYVCELNDGCFTMMTGILSICKCVATFAGPFLLVGEFLVKCAIESNCHYCDSTGELEWVEDISRKYDESAKLKHLKVLPCCGFDYVPADLMVHGLKKNLKEKERLSTYKDGTLMLMQTFESSSLDFSAGTMRTAMNSMSKVPFLQFCRHLRNPYAMIEGSHASLSDKHRRSNEAMTLFPVYSDELGQYISPFIMTAYLVKYFHWANFSTGDMGLGSDVVYVPGVGKSWFAAMVMAFTTLLTEFVMLILSKFAFVRNRIPGSGTGPDLSKKQHYMKTSLVARSVSSSRKVVSCLYEWKFSRGEAYVFTATAVVEAGLSMALSSAELPDRCGVLPPSIALGDTYLTRMEKAGIESRFVVMSE